MGEFHGAHIALTGEVRTAGTFQISGSSGDVRPSWPPAETTMKDSSLELYIL